KDEPGTMQGSVPTGRSGPNFHELARTLASMETTRQWKQFEADIRNEYKEKAKLIIPALRGKKIPGLKVRVVPKLPVKTGQAVQGTIDLTLINPDMKEPMDVVLTV